MALCVAKRIGKFKALSSGYRRMMLSTLSTGPSPASEVAGLAGTWPSGLKHLRLLEASGLIHTEKIGRTRMCYLNADALKYAGAWLARLSTMSR